MQKRRQKIVEIINREGQISFARLKNAFADVSEMTLRTDLKALDEMGAIIRIHGGARSVDTVTGTEIAFAQKTSHNIAEKSEIAVKAVKLLKACSSVFIDSGSTTTAMCRLVPDEVRHIYTSGISCAMELCGLKKPRVHMPGGLVNGSTVSITGSKTVLDIRSCHFDICFLGVTSFSPEYGFCCEIQDDALIKQVAMERSDRVVVLMDSGKYGMTNTYCFAETEAVDMVVSDSGLTDEQRNYFERKGIAVL